MPTGRISGRWDSPPDPPDGPMCGTVMPSSLLHVSQSWEMASTSSYRVATQ